MLLLSYSLVPYGAAAGAVDPTTGQLLPQPPSTVDVSRASSAAGPAAVTGAAGISGGGAKARSLAAAGNNGSAVAQAASGSAASIVAASSSSSSSVLTLQLPFWLDFPSVDESSPAAASVRVTLLGPYTGRVGQPVMLSWQLARIASADSGPDLDQAAYSSVALDDVSQQQQQGVGGGLNGYVDSSSSSRQLAAPGSARQQGISGESDELLCYDLLFGQQQSKQEGAGMGKDIVSSRAASGTAANAAAAAAEADMGGMSGSANAALLWGVTGAPPSGVARLGRAAGSLAVVEIALVPQAAGRLSAPQLVLKSPGGNQLVLVEGSSGHNNTLTISR